MGKDATEAVLGLMLLYLSLADCDVRAAFHRELTHSRQ
jgi:hypothetical protein